MKHKKMGIEFGYNVDDLMGYIISRLQTINYLKKKNGIYYKIARVIAREMKKRNSI
jgi:oligoribonuclease NrnB/cAMP/cGMP phosphodiesterase (DHH superfamily)